MKKYIPLYLLALIAIVLLAILLDKTMVPPAKKDILAVQVQDGRLLFGELHGNQLCDYYQVNVHVDPKTKKQIPSIDKGGVSYGGDGCVTLLEPILWTEPLNKQAPLYSQLSHTTP